MPRIRTIKPEFFSHEELASKSPHARLLAIGLLTLADCEGRLRWVPMQVHSQVFPWEATVKIEELLGELLDVGYLFHYEVEGKRYVEIVNFTKHQRLSGKEAKYESRLPARPQDCEKPNDLPIEGGEEKGKRQSASPGTLRNRGTGEQEEQGNKRNSKPPKAEVDRPDEVDEQTWLDWKAGRRGKKAGPITQTVLKKIRSEAEKAGLSLQEAIEEAAGWQWITFKEEYYSGNPRSNGTPKTRARVATAEELANWSPTGN